MTTATPDRRAIVSRIKAALPALMQHLNDSGEMPFSRRITIDELDVARVPTTFVTGQAFHNACAVGSEKIRIGTPMTGETIGSRLLVVETTDEDEWMLADIAVYNSYDQRLWLATFEFNNAGDLKNIENTRSYEDSPLNKGGAQYIEACVTKLLLDSADDKLPGSGTSCTVIDGIKVYEYKQALDSDVEHQDHYPVQLSPRVLPRLRDDIAKEMRNFSSISPFKMSQKDIEYFNEIGVSLEKSNEMWWVSEDMSKLAWDVAMSGTEPEDLSEKELPAPSGIMWLNGGGGPALVTKHQPDAEFFETGQTETEILSINAIIWYTPTIGIPGLEVGKPRFMGLSASPALTRDTSQWSRILSPMDLESNQIEFHRLPTYVTYHSLKFLPRKMALIVMRLSREETVGERVDADVVVTGEGKKKKQRSKKIETITCASLRRHRYTSDAEREAEAREYSHRWIVRGHMRNQPYGPRHVEGGQKHERVWIAPYIKGPEDKPLVLKDRVQVWRR